ncbi:MAG: AraC family transcriptional regulator [Thermomicrobiales bacterium]
MVQSEVGKPRGLLRPGQGARKFQLTLHAPAPDLDYFVEHYWIVAWDLRGQEPYLQENLSHPSVNLTIEPGWARITGVVTGRFSYLLKDEGWVFGVKFRPGAFYPFVNAPISRYTDRVFPLAEVFGAAGAALDLAMRAAADDQAAISPMEAFLRQRSPERDEQVALVNQIIALVVAERAITRVDDIVSRFDLSKRTLQRLFSRYVGVSPKWVIMRYRLHEAAERLAGGEVADWRELAFALGYADQAHFIKDFHAIVGSSPAEYARKASAARA